MNNNKNLIFIDCMRGIAILMVVLVHTAEHITNLSAFSSLLSQFGQMGVQLFFIASAFTLCLSLDSENAISRVTIITFYIKRIFRISPLYYIGIIVYFCYYYSVNIIHYKSYQIPDEYSLFNVFSNTIFIHGLFPTSINTVVPGGWSIGTEFLFYMIFPFLFEKLRESKNKNLFLCLCLIVTVLYRVILFNLGINGNKEFNNTFYYFFFINQLPCFLLGLILWENFPTLKKMYSQNKAISVITCVLMIVFAALSFKFYYDITCTPFIASIGFIIMFIISSELLNSALLSKIGKLSFSIYLFHFIIAWTFPRIINKYLMPHIHSDIILLISFIVVTAISYVIASLSNKLIEKRGIMLGKRISNNINKIS